MRSELSDRVRPECPKTPVHQILVLWAAACSIVMGGVGRVSAASEVQVGDAYARGSTDNRRWVIGTKMVEMGLECGSGKFRLVSYRNKLTKPATEYVASNEASDPLLSGTSYLVERYKVERIWMKDLKPGVVVDPAEDKLHFSVKKDDLIGFAVGPHGRFEGDSVKWVTTVDYGNGESYTSSDDKNVAQGPLWFYYLRMSDTGFLAALDGVADEPNGKVRIASMASGLWAWPPNVPKVGGVMMHPSNDYDVVRMWKAPKDGTISLHGKATVVGGEVDVQVLRVSETVVKPAPVPPALDWLLEKGEVRQVVFGGRPAVQLDLTLRESSLRVLYHVLAFPGTPVLRQWTELQNVGQEAVSLKKHDGLFSVNLQSGDQGPFTACWMTGGNNDTATGGKLYRESVAPAYHKDLLGKATYNWTPWVAVHRNGGAGDGLFVTLDYMGEWRLAFDREPSQPLQVSARLRIEDPSPKMLDPGETIVLPTVTTGVFHRDLDDMAASLYAWQYEYLWDYTHDDWFTLMPWTVECWYDDKNLQQQFAGRLAHSDADAVDWLRECGLEVVWNDAGWAANWPEGIFAGNREGPDYAESLRYVAKTGMKWMLWSSGDPGSGILDTKVGSWGNFQWRTDGVGGGNKFDRSFREEVTEFLQKHPRCSWHTCSGGGTYAHTFDWQRYGDIHYDTDWWTECSNSYFSYLDLPDKWFDNLACISPTRRRMLTMVPKYCFLATGEEMKVIQCIAGLYHYLLQTGVAGRWSLTAHPIVKGDDEYHYFQRVSFDRKRSLIILKHEVKGEVTIYPRGLLPEHNYLVEGGAGKPEMMPVPSIYGLRQEIKQDAGEPSNTRKGDDVMTNGIQIKDQPAGVYIYLNLPNRPATGRDKTAPTSPGRVLSRRETNLGHTGVMLYWSSGADNNWVSCYQVRRGDLILGRTATGLTFFDRSPGWDVKAEYSVRTVDGDGNTSNWVKAVPAPDEPLTYAALGAHYSEAHRNGWSAEISTDGHTYQPMTWIPRDKVPTAEFFGGTPNQRGGAEGYWEGAGTARCGRGWQQASASSMCVRTWVAPQPGTVRIAGKAVKEYYHRSQGGPLNVRIMQGERHVWPASGWATVPLNNLDGVTHDLTLDVKLGDAIRFVLDKGTSPENDLLAWMPRIVYAETPQSTEQPAVVRILCGAKKPYVDKTGNTWSVDTFYDGGNSVEAQVPIEGALPTAEDAELYQHGRSGKQFSYSIPVPVGLYAVRLKFAETKYDYYFQRPFNLDINGRRVLRNVDICQAARGPRRPHERVFRYLVPDESGHIVLYFSGGWEPTMESDEAMVQAIEVLPELKPHIRINAGSECDVVDWGGYVWNADRDYRSGTAISTDKAVSQASPTLYDQSLYRTARTGKDFLYTVSVPPGLYVVHLKFAELWLNELGKRPMDVEVNGRKFLRSWDPAATAGKIGATSDVRFEDITPDGNGRITVRLIATGANEAILQGVEIE